MSSELRLYLMLRRQDATWSVSVHRDLIGALRAWSSRDESGSSGVLHVGFDRPACQAFDDVAESYSGRVLLTASARFALPSGFKASFAITEVAELPIYLAVSGWGYEVDPAELVTADDHRNSASSNPSREPEGWVVGFISAYPDFAQTLAAHSICDDPTYLCYEKGLPTALRRELGIYRYDALVTDVGDPAAVARAAPPWFSTRSFDTIDLTVRVSNVFNRAAIGCVNDLAALSFDELLKLPSFGLTSVRDLCASLHSAMREGPVDLGTAVTVQGGQKSPVADSDDQSLVSLIRQSLLGLPEKDRDIVERRMGWNGEIQTLQEIGTAYGLTRERIRQLENRAVQRLRKSGWQHSLTKKLTVLLSEREFPLPVIGVEAVDRWFGGIAGHLGAFRYIMANLYQGDATLIEVDGVDYFSAITSKQWEATIREARSLLQSGVQQNWTKQHCRAVVSGLLPIKANEFKLLLWDKAIVFCHFAAGTGDEEVLTAYGRGVEQVVEAVLSESDEPLHYSIIANLAADRAGKSIDVRRAHNAAADVGYLLGRGTYGLDRHLPDASILEEIADLSEEIVQEGPAGRQWHASEILGSLVEMEESLVENNKITKYIVDVALKKSGVLKGLGRLVWAAQTAADEVARIDVQDAIVSLLKQAGRPLRSSEIRQQLIVLRGVNETFQIGTAAVDPLIRLGDGLWGLNDRDVSIKRSDQPRFTEGLIALLAKHEVGVHVIELRTSNLLEATGLNAHALFSLACLDGRLAVSNGYLYLRAWGGPRRESLSEAVRSILTGSSSALSVDELVSLVEARLRRPVLRNTIFNTLRAIEAYQDPSSGKWFSPLATDDQEDLALSA